MIELKPGDSAPPFTAGQGAHAITLQQLAAGQPLVLYFYPKDDTPSCTAEAMDFTSLADAFAQAGVHLVGISPDSAKSHEKFVTKHDLAVRLLSDPDKSIAMAYGVWGEKTMYGRTFMGVERATFLIDRNGRIARTWRNVRVKGHAADVLTAAQSLRGHAQAGGDDA